MPKALSWTLFGLLAFGLFALFQFEADSRRKRAELEYRVEELNLKLSTFIKRSENDPARQELSHVNVTQQQLEDKFQKDKKTVTELLDLMVGKDEKFSRELQQIRNEIDLIKARTGLAAD